MSRFGKIKCRKLMDPEAQRVRAPENIIIEELEGYRGRGAKAGGELLDQFHASAALRPQQYREFLLVIRRLERIEFRNQFAQRLIPGNFFELALTARARAFERVQVRRNSRSEEHTSE